MKKEQIGRSMVEMVGVLAIIGVLAVGVYSVYVMASRKMNAGKTVDLVQDMINDIRTAHSVRTDYYGVAPSENQNIVNRFISKNIIDRSLCGGVLACNAGGCTCTGAGGAAPLKHPLSGPMNITVNAGERTLSITLFRVMRAGCVNIVSSDWGTGGGESNVVRRMVVNGNVVNQGNLNANVITNFPVGVSDANNACSNGVDNTIEFVVKPLRNN